MLNKTLESINETDISALADNQVQEGRTLDYKLELPSGKDEDKREFWRDITSFANAAGGDILFGVEEAKDGAGKNLGHPARILGVPIANEDAERLRLEALVRDGADPKIPGVRIQFIGGFPRGPVVIVRVPRSWASPHITGLNKDTRFYSRNSAGKYPLDVREIRAAFLAHAELEDRVRRFRDERLGRIVADEIPVRLKQGARAVFHIIPLSSLSDPQPVDLQPFSRAPPPPPEANGWNHRFNLDGFVTYSGREGALDARSYLQMFRQGAVEGVVAVGREVAGERFYWPRGLEQLLQQDVIQTVRLIAHRERSFPCVVFLSVLGARGSRLPPSALRGVERENYQIDRDQLLFPEVLLDEPSKADFTAFRELCDALWQAVGLPRSLSFDPQGGWLENFRW